MSDFIPSSALIAFGEYAKRQAALDGVPDKEAALWEQIADEITSYIDTGETSQPDLFGAEA